MASTYLSKADRKSLIDEYIDCYEDTGGDDPDGERERLESMNNSELIKEIKSSGWDIL